MIVTENNTPNVLWTLVTCSQNYEGSQWFGRTVDLSRFAGKTVKIAFRSQTNDSQFSLVGIDDVAVSSGGAAPTTTPTATVAPNATQSPATATPTSTAASQSTATATPAQAVGISGRVTAKGIAVANLNIGLVRYNSFTGRWDVIGTAKTDSQGIYLFLNVGQLTSPYSYVVVYRNGINGGNTDNPAYLSFWRSFFITTYNPAIATDGGSFDIADVTLASPPDNTFHSAPTTFTWNSRNLAGDAYSWAIASLPVESSLENCHSAALATTSYELNLQTYADCGLTINLAYAWYIYVGKADGSAYGQSHEYRTITFNPPTALSNHWHIIGK